MSNGADAADDDASMTRDAGASRTFRSIFGGAAARQELRERADELKRRLVASGDRELSSDERASNALEGAGDDDDEGAWSDDAAPPRSQRDNNRAHHAAALDAGFSSGEEEEAAGTLRTEELRAPQRQVRSMAEWADDDEEEDAWKDMLQAKVNQLELVIQSSEGSPVTSLADARATTAVAQLEVADARIALAAATHIAALRGAERPATRGKLQHAADVLQRQGTATAAAAALSSPPNYLRKRTGSRDLGPSSRASKVPAAEAKRFAKVPASSSSRRDALPRSASANALSSALASHAAQRKNSLDACGVGGHRAAAAPAAAVALKAAHKAHALSDAEAVRRFLLDDIKQMSMDRLVADAKRLQFLQALYKQQQQQQHGEGG